MEKNNIDNETLISLVLAILSWFGNYFGIFFAIGALFFYYKIKDKSKIEAKIALCISIISLTVFLIYFGFVLYNFLPNK